MNPDSNKTDLTKKALEYHSIARPGKIEILPTKPCYSQQDLSLAYSPGVAAPCLAIVENPANVALYTARSNLVGIISNGSAVLGLGNIGPLASKPVMEGKSILFKVFADIDAYDIEINAPSADEMVELIHRLEPTFGGINLEDIKAPECFEVEKRLKERMNIPIFHDDQHGTAIISGAGLLNALEINGQKIEDMKLVVFGAGAAAIASSNLYIALGVDPNNIDMFDSKGHLHSSRKDLNIYKQGFSKNKKEKTLAEALMGAHLFLGLSTKDVLNPELLSKMAKHPVIFACANPDPEIAFPVAKAARPDCIMGTGRSDYPNQINNVSGFPFIFRGTLDVEATDINEAMKIAATHALSALAKEPVPDEICQLYGVKSLSFGPDYIIPKPFDTRLAQWISPAVAKAAMETGVARKPITDLDMYAKSLGIRIAKVQERSKTLCESYL